MKFIMYEVKRGTGYASLINSEEFIAIKKNTALYTFSKSVSIL